MSYFLSDQKLALGQQFVLAGEEARHILLSRRMKHGEKFNLQGVDGNRFVVELTEVNKNRLTVRAVEKISPPEELKISVTLFQSAVNEKALDFILQKATELGAAKIVLFNSQNTATKMSADLFKKKFERWNKILWEAAKQSDRAKVPELEFLSGIEGVTAAAKDLDKVLLADISGERVNRESLIVNSLGLVIGPEGGFTKQETDELKSLENLSVISISPFTLRAETAAIAALAVIQNI